MLCAMAGKFLNSFFTMPFLGSITHHIASEDNGWNLILVNHDNYIPADYKVQLTELSNGKKVDSRIYPELQEEIIVTDHRHEGDGGRVFGHPYLISLKNSCRAPFPRTASGSRLPLQMLHASG